ncbi:MAG TPA: 5'-nucleotidase [Gimesia maris]|uniref:5'-nucleotidase n=1 Tax=Gimesia maris TaxID=122 RepID=A0A3D3R3S4_9PLAN|nr:5'-nucleotidase [Gimesia maris]|tara:strand:+ start:3609 stop:4124 length:516 start_codon:yes stop_codon:yes gene_type:complete
MQSPLVNDDLWNRRGISLLWDADELNSLCQPNQVISLRQLRQLHHTGWPEDDLPLVNDTALVVAGLEACIDSLPPEDATQWLEQIIYPLNVSFQREVADGGGQAALVFWMVEHNRLQYRTSEDAWYWHCGGEHKKHQIPLSHCLFNGAQHDLKEIQDTNGNRLGLYHPRIS